MSDQDPPDNVLAAWCLIFGLICGIMGTLFVQRLLADLHP